jgi:hypothetical protein
MELHRTSDQKSLLEVEHADMQDLIKSGWIGPEAFAAKGRDGRPDIWGVICRPRNLDPARKYPVIANATTFSSSNSSASNRRIGTKKKQYGSKY